MKSNLIPINFGVGAETAGGKTTVGNELVNLLERAYPPGESEPPWQVVDLGGIARARAKEMGASIEAEAVDRPSEIDLAIEEACREAFRRGRSVVLGRLPWMVASEREFSDDAFRVWIEASPETRATRRAAQNGGHPYAEVLADVRGRDESDAKRYAAIYPHAPFPPPEDSHMLDLVISAEKFNQLQIAEHIVECARVLRLRGPSAFAKVHR